MATDKSPFDLAAIIYDTSFNIVSTVLDHKSIQVQLGINEPGVATITVPRTHHLVGTTSSRYFCEIYMSGDTTFSSARIFQGELERTTYRVNENRKEYVYVFSGLLAVLQQAIVAWAAGTDNRSSFESEDIHDVIDNVINYNFLFTLSPTDRARQSDNRHVQSVIGVLTGPVSPISIDFSCAWRNVYDVVLQLLEASSYDIIGNYDKTFNRVTFELDYDGIGEDKTSNIFLSEEWGTILGYEIIKERSDYKNVAIVGGGGQEENRTLVVRTSADYTTSALNAEMFVDARQTTVTSALETAGDSALVQSKQRTRYNVKLAWHYINLLHPNDPNGDLWLGDQVTWIADRETHPVRITGLTISSSDGRVNATLTVEDS